MIKNDRQRGRERGAKGRKKRRHSKRWENEGWEVKDKVIVIVDGGEREV